MFEKIVDKAPVRLMVPLVEIAIVSEVPSMAPAEHSPATDPDAKLLFAAVIASRRVQRPSVAFATSAILLTVIVLPAWTCRTGNRSKTVTAEAKTKKRIRDRVRRGDRIII